MALGSASATSIHTGWASPTTGTATATTASAWPRLGSSTEPGGFDPLEILSLRRAFSPAEGSLLFTDINSIIYLSC